MGVLREYVGTDNGALRPDLDNDSPGVNQELLLAKRECFTAYRNLALAAGTVEELVNLDKAAFNALMQEKVSAENQQTFAGLADEQQTALWELISRTTAHPQNQNSDGSTNPALSRGDAKSACKDVLGAFDLAVEQYSLAKNPEEEQRRIASIFKYGLGAFVSAHAGTLIANTGTRLEKRYGATTSEVKKGRIAGGLGTLAVAGLVGWTAARAFASFKGYSVSMEGGSIGAQNTLDALSSASPTPTSSPSISEASSAASSYSPSPTPSEVSASATPSPSPTIQVRETPEIDVDKFMPSNNPATNPEVAGSIPLPTDIADAMEKAGDKALKVMPDAEKFMSQLEKISVKQGEGPYGLFDRMGIPESQHKAFLEYLWDNKSSLTGKHGDKYAFMYVADKDHHILGLNHVGKLGNHAQDTMGKHYSAFIEEIRTNAEQSKAAQLLQKVNLDPKDYGIDLPAKNTSGVAPNTVEQYTPTKSEIRHAETVAKWATDKDSSLSGSGVVVELQSDTKNHAPGNPWEVTEARVHAATGGINPALNPADSLFANQRQYQEFVWGLDKEVMHLNDMSLSGSYHLPVGEKIKTFSNNDVNEALRRFVVEQSTGKSAQKLSGEKLQNAVDSIFKGTNDATIWEKGHTLANEVIDFAHDRGLRISEAQAKELAEHLEKVANENNFALYTEATSILGGDKYHMSNQAIAEAQKWYETHVMRLASVD